MSGEFNLDTVLRMQTMLDTEVHKNRVHLYINLLIKEIMDRALTHDASKMENPELPIFAEYSSKLAGSTYGSEEYNRYLKEMQIAIEHHYANNRHHPEHFPNGIKDMTLVDVVEMFCDWAAAAKRQNNGNILTSIDKNQERFHMSQELTQVFKNTARLLE